MKEKFKTLINNKNLIIILIITLIISIGTTGTYAWFTWSNPSNTNLTLTIGNIDVMFDTGNNINITNLSPVLYPEEGAKATFSLKKNNTSLDSIIYTITLDITTISNELKSTDFKWALMKKDTTTVISGGNFSSASNGNTITLYSDALIDTNKVSYDLYFYIDGNSENNSNMMNKTLTGTINISGEEKETLASYITNLYNTATKSTVTNNGITYNYATSVSLMNDRLGSSTTDINGGNIRYYGANPNNYIYFNCSDYSNQNDTTCEKWRIIGVFNGKVKLIRDESIGNYSWDTSASIVNSGKGVNDWSQADIMKLLNPSDYYTIDLNNNGYGQSLYYNGQSGTCFSGENNATVSCDFTSTGLKNDTTRNMISAETYYLRGYNSSSVYSDQMYNYERTTGGVYNTRPTSWTGKIALPYPSDYGYAADFSYCTQTLDNYYNSTCASNNWMKRIIENNGNYNGWLLTSTSDNLFSAWFVALSGPLYPGNFTSFAYRVAPVLSLNFVLEVQSGTIGTSSNPYKLAIRSN